MNKAKFFIAPLLLLIFAGITQAAEITETFKKQLNANESTRLVLENTNGSVEVRPSAGDDIEIVAYKRVRADDRDRAAELMQHLEVVVEQRGDEIEIITKYPRRSSGHGGFWSWVMGRSGGTSYSVSYEVRVPQKFDMDLKSTNGRVEVGGVEGRIRLQTTNGKIVAEDVAGALRCHTTNGSITAIMRFVMDDEMHFTSTNGSIKLYLPYDTGAEVSAKTTNGSIRCDLPIRRTFKETKRSLNAQINDGGPMLYMKTTNGSIRIRES